eukprot:TRINITY_DN1835_c0_g1_i2.p1 TRINITY_DN1835_c0_g1~~TRINITY_DN1835_c0_g1_i2.p1  ORF type:complete len:1453 (-),score=372.94 TRINITY_DN1835_c0_g1_i2:674-5032(-)
MSALVREVVELVRGGLSADLSVVTSKKLIYCFGETGCGKSTFCSIISGEGIKFESNKFHSLSPDPTFKIGHSKESFTSSIHVKALNDSWVLGDGPGFQDTRGDVVEIRNMIQMVRVIKECAGLVPLLFVNYHSLKNRRGNEIIGLLRYVCSLFNNNITILEQSVVCVFTNVPDMIKYTYFEESLQGLGQSFRESDSVPQKLLDILIEQCREETAILFGSKIERKHLNRFKNIKFSEISKQSLEVNLCYNLNERTKDNLQKECRNLEIDIINCLREGEMNEGLLDKLKILFELGEHLPIPVVKGCVDECMEEVQKNLNENISKEREKFSQVINSNSEINPNSFSKLSRIREFLMNTGNMPSQFQLKANDIDNWMLQTILDNFQPEKFHNIQVICEYKFKLDEMKRVFPFLDTGKPKDLLMGHLQKKIQECNDLAVNSFEHLDQILILLEFVINIKTNFPELEKMVLSCLETVNTNISKKCKKLKKNLISKLKGDNLVEKSDIENYKFLKAHRKNNAIINLKKFYKDIQNELIGICEKIIESDNFDGTLIHTIIAIQKVDEKIEEKIGDLLRVKLNKLTNQVLKESQKKDNEFYALGLLKQNLWIDEERSDKKISLEYKAIKNVIIKRLNNLSKNIENNLKTENFVEAEKQWTQYNGLYEKFSKYSESEDATPPPLVSFLQNYIASIESKISEGSLSLEEANQQYVKVEQCNQLLHHVEFNKGRELCQRLIQYIEQNVAGLFESINENYDSVERIDFPRIREIFSILHFLDSFQVMKNKRYLQNFKNRIEQWIHLLLQNLSKKIQQDLCSCRKEVDSLNVGFVSISNFLPHLRQELDRLNEQIELKDKRNMVLLEDLLSKEKYHEINELFLIEQPSQQIKLKICSSITNLLKETRKSLLILVKFDDITIQDISGKFYSIEDAFDHLQDILSEAHRKQLSEIYSTLEQLVQNNMEKVKECIKTYQLRDAEIQYNILKKLMNQIPKLKVSDESKDLEISNIWKTIIGDTNLNALIINCLYEQYKTDRWKYVQILELVRKASLEKRSKILCEDDEIEYSYWLMNLHPELSSSIQDLNPLSPRYPTPRLLSPRVRTLPNLVSPSELPSESQMENLVSPRYPPTQQPTHIKNNTPTFQQPQTQPIQTTPLPQPTTRNSHINNDTPISHQSQTQPTQPTPQPNYDNEKYNNFRTFIKGIVNTPITFTHILEMVTKFKEVVFDMEKLRMLGLIEDVEQISGAIETFIQFEIADLLDGFLLLPDLQGKVGESIKNKFEKIKQVASIPNQQIINHGVLSPLLDGISTCIKENYQNLESNLKDNNLNAVLKILQNNEMIREILEFVNSGWTFSELKPYLSLLDSSKQLVQDWLEQSTKSADFTKRLETIQLLHNQEDLIQFMGQQFQTLYNDTLNTTITEVSNQISETYYMEIPHHIIQDHLLLAQSLEDIITKIMEPHFEKKK